MHVDVALPHIVPQADCWVAPGVQTPVHAAQSPFVQTFEAQSPLAPQTLPIGQVDAHAGAAHLSFVQSPVAHSVPIVQA